MSLGHPECSHYTFVNEVAKRVLADSRVDGPGAVGQTGSINHN